MHFRHTGSLIGALIKANKPYDLQVFPNGRHWTSDEQSRVHMEQVYVIFTFLVFIHSLSLSLRIYTLHKGS